MWAVPAPAVVDGAEQRVGGAHRHVGLLRAAQLGGQRVRQLVRRERVVCSAALLRPAEARTGRTGVDGAVDEQLHGGGVTVGGHGERHHQHVVAHHGRRARAVPIARSHQRAVAHALVAHCVWRRPRCSAACHAVSPATRADRLPGAR